MSADHRDVTDKHKSVGLAGASLLQLASAAAEDPAPLAGIGQNASNLLPPTPPEQETAVGGGNSSPRAGALPESGLEQRGLSEPASYPPVADAPRRRASFNAPAPVATSAEAMLPDRRDEPRRRDSMPATPLLPSVQSLLEDIPRNRFKRHREEGADRSYDMGVDSSSSLLAPPPPAAPEPMRLAVDGIRGGTGAERGSAPAPGCGDGRDRGSSSGSTAMETESHGATAVADASARSRPPTKASRVFTGPSAGSNQQDGGGWAQRAWNSNQSPSIPTGIMTSSPSPDWRRHGLASIGRTASFDEARVAASKNGSGMKMEEASSKPRRASAFVAQASTLPPVVTEVGRRESALELRGMQPPPRSTYRELLSASGSSRSITAFNGRPGYSPSLALLNPDARIEEERDGEMAARGGGGGDASRSRPPPVSRAAARMFHVMPAAAAFNAGLPPRSPSGTASSLGQQGGVGDRRRFSFLDKGSSGAAEKDGGASTFVPAWGAPGEEGDGDWDGNGDDGAAAAAAAAAASEKNEAGNPRPPRRGSMAPLAPAGRMGAQPRRWPVSGSPDHDGGTAAGNAFVPAWGASEEKPTEEPTRSSSTSARGTARRAKALFGGGGGVGTSDSGSGSGSGSGTEGGLVSQRSGMLGTGKSAAYEGPGGTASGPRRWSTSERSSPAPDHRGSPANAFVRPSWGEATEDRAAEGPSSSSSPVCQQNANGAMRSSRRGSMAPGAMLPPAPRRGSVVAHGPVSTSSSSQRRGSVVMGGMAPSVKEVSGGRQGVEGQRSFMAATRPGEHSADTKGGMVISEDQQQWRQQQHQHLHQQHQQHQHSRSGCFGEGVEPAKAPSG